MHDNAMIATAADAAYFDLLQGLVASIRDKPEGAGIAIGVLDLGLTSDQAAWLRGQGATLAEPGWDFDVPASMNAPGHFRALLARPFLPRYFPGFDVYLHIDADAWVQHWPAVENYLRAAARGMLAITPQVDRAYNTIYKRPRRLGRTQNFKSFRWSYGWRLADRLGRNPILNCGVFALPARGDHWALWQAALRRALGRRTFPARRGWPHLHFKLVEQTAMNYVVFHDRAPATFLPATHNWFCALAAPRFDAATGLLVEPHAPYAPIGIVHLAGEDFQNRVFALEPLAEGDARRETRLRYDDLKALRAGRE